MTSPAQRHMMRVSAAMTAQREAAPLRHATVYEQMLVKLAADQRTLKAIYSKELKAAKKRELLPFWLPWVNGVLEQGKGAQDDILMTVMLWRLDTGDIAGIGDAIVSELSEAYICFFTVTVKVGKGIPVTEFFRTFI